MLAVVGLPGQLHHRRARIDAEKRGDMAGRGDGLDPFLGTVQDAAELGGEQLLQRLGQVRPQQPAESTGVEEGMFEGQSVAVGIAQPED